MKHFFCAAMVLLMSVGYGQTTEVSVVELKGRTEYVEFATFSPDGKKIVTIFYDASVRIWDAETGKELHKLEGHTSGEGLRVNFSPDGTKIATIGDWDGISRIWDVETGKKLYKLEGCGAIFFPEGKRIATNRGFTTRIWDVESRNELQKIEEVIVDFLPGNKKFVTRSWDSTVRIRDTESGKELQKIEEGGCVFLTPDDKRIVTVINEITRIWDVESGKELQKFPRRFVHFSSNGKKIVTTGDWDDILRIWDAETGKELRQIKAPSAFPAVTTFQSAVFSPDGKKVAIVGNRGYAAIWTLE